VAIRVACNEQVNAHIFGENTAQHRLAPEAAPAALRGAGEAQAVGRLLKSV